MSEFGAKKPSLAMQARMLAHGERVSLASTTKGGYRRISLGWLRAVSSTLAKNDNNLASLRKVLDDLLDEPSNKISPDDLQEIERVYRETWGASPARPPAAS